MTTAPTRRPARLDSGSRPLPAARLDPPPARPALVPERTLPEMTLPEMTFPETRPPGAAGEAPHVEPAALKAAMRRLPGGVVVVTAGTDEERVGLTATSAVSLSVDPPTMLVCVNRASSTWPVIARRRHFCVSILGAEHQAVAERFAGIGALRGAARYAGAEWVVMRSGASGLAGAQAIVDCEIEEVIERHSHAILLGAVREVRVARRETGSLVYRLGRFGSLPPS